MVVKHLEILLEADEQVFEVYQKTLKACSVAIGKTANSIWQQQNAIGRNPEAIVIAKEEESDKLFWAVGKLLRLKKMTGIPFVPDKKVELTDDIRWKWCESFYADALEAISQMR